MNVRLPSRLPPVVGRGSIASGFRLAFAAINALMDAIERVEVHSSPTVRRRQTSTGTVLEGAAVAETTTTTEGGPARWS
jgi:hypothetical protein